VCDERADWALGPGMAAAVESFVVVGAHVGYRAEWRYVQIG
jgi:hypothetical protein